MSISSKLENLLSDEDKKTLISYINDHGYMSIENVVTLFNSNINNSDYTLIDEDIIINTDLRIDYPIFITKDSIYNREDIIKKYEMEKFNISPELIFNKQYIEVIDKDYYLYDPESSISKESKIGINTIYETKIYIGKDKWNEYLVMYQFMKSLSFITNIQKSITDNKINENVLNSFIKKE